MPGTGVIICTSGADPGQVIIESCRQRGVRLTELVEVRLWAIR